MDLTNLGGIYTENTTIITTDKPTVIKAIDVVSFAEADQIVIIKRDDIAFALFDIQNNEAQSRLTSTFIKKDEVITVECSGEVHITLSVAL